MRLQWLAYALGLGTGLMRGPRDSVMEVVVGLVTLGSYGAIVAWLIFKVARGRNWARIVYTVLLLLSYVSLATSWSTYSASYHGHPEIIVLDILDTLADVGGLYFMFTKAANAWFRPRATA